jgi:MFS family permease
MLQLLRFRRSLRGQHTDAHVLMATRVLRSFGDGFVSLVLARYLSELAFSGFQIGLIATATLLGTSAATLLVGALADRLGRRRVLLAAAVLMCGTGVGFATSSQFVPLLLIALVGTLNPTAGDVSVFLPIEQAILPQTVSDRQRTALFARYNLGGALAAAGGALFAGVPGLLERGFGWPTLDVLRGMFLLYAAVALAVAMLYSGLSPKAEVEVRPASRAPLERSRGVVFQLSALFAVDAFAGGLVVQSLLAFWLFERFGLSLGQAGAIFFAAGTAAAFSYLVAAWVAERIGLVNTMVFTHIPSNVLLALVPLMPTVWLAVALLIARFGLSQMDVPTRQSYVMAVVDPEERAAAASITGVSRALASAVSPALAGYLLGVTTFGIPLLLSGGLKTAYDLALLAKFRTLRPPEELPSAESGGLQGIGHRT